MLALLAGMALACTDEEGCSGHGTCDGGACVCEFGWPEQAAPDCSVSLPGHLDARYEAYWWTCFIVNVPLFVWSVFGTVAAFRIASVEGRQRLTLSVKCLAACAACAGFRLVQLAIGFSLGGAVEQGLTNVPTVMVALADVLSLRFWLTIVPPNASWVRRFRKFLGFAFPTVVFLLFPCIVLSVVLPPPLGEAFSAAYYGILGVYLSIATLIFCRYSLVIMRELRVRQATLEGNEVTRKTDAFLLKFTQIGLVATGVVVVVGVTFTAYIFDGGPRKPAAYFWGTCVFRGLEAFCVFLILLLMDPGLSGKLTAREAFDVVVHPDRVKRQRRAEAAALEQRISTAAKSRAADKRDSSSSGESNHVTMIDMGAVGKEQNRSARRKKKTPR